MEIGGSLSFPSSGLGTSHLEAPLPGLPCKDRRHLAPPRSRASGSGVRKPELGNQGKSFSSPNVGTRCALLRPVRRDCLFRQLLSASPDAITPDRLHWAFLCVKSRFFRVLSSGPRPGKPRKRRSVHPPALSGKSRSVRSPRVFASRPLSTINAHLHTPFLPRGLSHFKGRNQASFGGRAFYAVSDDLLAFIVDIGKGRLEPIASKVAM